MLVIGWFQMVEKDTKGRGEGVLGWDGSVGAGITLSLLIRLRAMEVSITRGCLNLTLWAL